MTLLPDEQISHQDCDASFEGMSMQSRGRSLLSISRYKVLARGLPREFRVIGTSQESTQHREEIGYGNSGIYELITKGKLKRAY